MSDAALKRFLWKKEALRLSGLLAAIAALDQILKALALSARLKSGSFLGFAMDIFPNEHFILSLEITTNALFKTIIITPVFVYVIFLYFLSIRYVPPLFNTIKIGWTMTVAGAISNMADKLRLGHVVDIVSFRFQELYIYFNFADIAQMAGAGVLLFGVFKGRKEIWRAIERRKTLIIMREEQWRFIRQVMWAAFCFGLFFFVINSQFLLQYQETMEELRQQLFFFALKYFGVVIALLLLPVLAVFVYISNKFFGPIYAFERHVRALLKGEDPGEFKLRAGDHLQRLKPLAEDIRRSLKNRGGLAKEAAKKSDGGEDGGAKA